MTFDTRYRKVSIPNFYFDTRYRKVSIPEMTFDTRYRKVSIPDMTFDTRYRKVSIVDTREDFRYQVLWSKSNKSKRVFLDFKNTKGGGNRKVEIQEHGSCTITVLTLKLCHNRYSKLYSSDEGPTKRRSKQNLIKIHNTMTLLSVVVARHLLRRNPDWN